MVENIKVFTHNSIRIQNGNKAIYIDPFEMKQAPHDADYILITHDHYDHFSPSDIAAVSKADTVLVVPEKMSDKTDKVRESVGKTETIAQGETKEFNGFVLETIPAYNTLKPFHMKSAGWVGYIFEADGKRVYVAGDTDVTKEALAVKCDIALVPIGGFYTMDTKAAAELVNTIKPEIAIPTHYGSIVGSPEDGAKFAALVNAAVKVEILMGID
ncbi:MAG: MBL fold metallo-hydrolase [Lachnospiraceae bacterium]|nr:MBL fold metallo-hydrolase [Lachnospiraceae bacterium]